MVENLPCNAEDLGSIPGPDTKILSASGQLSLCTTSTDFELYSVRKSMQNLVHKLHHIYFDYSGVVKISPLVFCLFPPVHLG